MKYSVAVKNVGLNFIISLKEKFRNPVLVALMIFPPAYFIFLAGQVVPDYPVFLEVLGEEKSMADVYPVSFTPVTASLVTALFGLFIMLEARDTDRRLLIAGSTRFQITVSRFLLISLISLLVSAISIGMMMLSFTPEDLIRFFLITVLISLIYGNVGMIAGILLNRMSGVYTMLILVTLDAGVFQNPFFMQEEPAWWMRILPAYHPMELANEIAFLGEIQQTSSLIYTLVILLILLSGATAAFYLNSK